MRIFFDTNVLASAFATRGLCAEMYELVALNHQLVIDEPVDGELLRILAGKLRVPSDKIAKLRRELSEFEWAPASDAPLASPIRDPADRAVVACAIAARADVVVTGDKELLDLRKIRSMPVVSPRELWRRLAGPGSEG
jgi:putative PIN family toxin of toxin-antitoxin system